jgi:hypothetical protein
VLSGEDFQQLWLVTRMAISHRKVSPTTIFDFRHAEILAPVDSHNQGRCGFLPPGNSPPIDNVAT